MSFKRFSCTRASALVGTGHEGKVKAFMLCPIYRLGPLAVRSNHRDAQLQLRKYSTLLMILSTVARF